ncbi:Hypothetical predicted protein [Pelobates cultripes]|uniref:Uncharacterized protein n=1 Tax=Pelobates cultripes TaxID=61616 RepID=A0AAD1SB09_PELCU|nr:Hypothetical predicted protein [Pelobates cultripes]
MGRNKRPVSHPTETGPQQSQQTGTLDGYLRTPTRQPRAVTGSKMADDRAPAQVPDAQEPSLADIRADIRALIEAMVTKSDLQALSANLHEVIRSEVATLQRDLTAQDGHIQTLEGAQQTAATSIEATNAAVARQGAMLLQIRRQTEDLDNRGCRSNIRIRNIPEAPGEEDVGAMLTDLFRAHKALRPRTTENPPRDIICGLHECTEVTDWVLGPLEQRNHQMAPRAPRRHREDSPQGRQARRYQQPAQQQAHPEVE